MKFKTLIKLSGTSAILAGILLFLLAASFITRNFVGDEAMIASSIFLSLGRVLEVFALMGFFALQYAQSGRLSLVGFILMVTGTMIDLFPPAGRVLFTLGVLFFSIANQKTHVLPIWPFWVWFGSAALILVSTQLPGQLLLSGGLIGSASALFWLGCFLRKHTKKMQP